MREKRRKSLEIIDVIRDAARCVAGGCDVTYFDGVMEETVPCPKVNYVFGNSTYVKDRLNELSLADHGTSRRFPLIALFVPFTEQRGMADCHAKAKLQILIATSTKRDWSNEQRERYSFEGVLRPIYRRFIEALSSDPRVVTPYRGSFPHRYSENYSYGKYGAYDHTGGKLTDSIDAIDITEFEITIKNHNCTSR